MTRSLKKGPFVQPKLLKKIEAMNASGEKRVIRTWSGPALFSHRWWGTPLPYTMVAVTCQFTLRKIWLGIGLGEFVPTRFFRGHIAKEKKGR
jgi:small subunit ribosomal protein S19